MARLPVAGLLVLVLIAGCRPARVDLQPVGESGGTVPAPVVFVENKQDLSAETRTWVQNLHRTPGIHTRREGAYQHVLFALGERPTGGFRVQLEAVVEYPDHILVEAFEVIPGPGDIVTQALTYPYLLVTIIDADKPGRGYLNLVYQEAAKPPVAPGDPGPPEQVSPGPPQPVPLPGAPLPPFFRENELPLSAETQAWLERMHRTPGTHIRREGDYQHVLIAVGERPTGGFRVVVEMVADRDDYVLVQAMEIAPAPDAMVTQVLTYPYLLLSFRHHKEVRVSIALAGSPGGSPGK